MIIFCLHISVEISPDDISEKGHTNITVQPTTTNNSIYMVNRTKGVVVEGKASERELIDCTHSLVTFNGICGKTVFILFAHIKALHLLG